VKNFFSRDFGPRFRRGIVTAGAQKKKAASKKRKEHERKEGASEEHSVRFPWERRMEVDVQSGGKRVPRDGGESTGKKKRQTGCTGQRAEMGQNGTNQTL